MKTNVKLASERTKTEEAVSGTRTIHKEYLRDYAKRHGGKRGHVYIIL
jgi:hypothetical protein